MSVRRGADVAHVTQQMPRLNMVLRAGHPQRQQDATGMHRRVKAKGLGRIPRDDIEVNIFDLPQLLKYYLLMEIAEAFEERPSQFLPAEEIDKWIDNQRISVQHVLNSFSDTMFLGNDLQDAASKFFDLDFGESGEYKNEDAHEVKSMKDVDRITNKLGKYILSHPRFQIRTIP